MLKIDVLDPELACRALDRARGRITSDIEHTKRLRTMSEPLKAVRVAQLREDYRRLEVLREAIMRQVIIERSTIPSVRD